MYNKYKSYDYNDEITENREQLNVRWGNCGRYLADAFI